ncbi:MAG: hypothetical protein KKE86_17400 [Planctomycetes bacterium]|nr:hypothetical protein [Planctomycetota bacterium]
MGEKTPKRDIDDMSPEEALELMEKGERVDLTPPPPRDNMTVLTLRVDYDTLDRITKMALAEDSKPSAVARSLIHQALAHLDYYEALTPDFSNDIENIVSKYLDYRFRQITSTSFYQSSTFTSPAPPGVGINVELEEVT